MKKVFTVFCVSVILFASYNASAQADIDKGNVLLNAGLGFGYYYAGGVPVMFSAEFAINDVITVGPYLGITSYNRNYGFGYKYSYNFIDFGARGAYHFSKHLNLNTDKLDLYGGVFLGYVASSFTYRDNNGNKVNGGNDLYGSGVRGGLFGGARWYFSNRFGAYGELGYGLAPLSIGLTFKI